MKLKFVIKLHVVGRPYIIEVFYESAIVCKYYIYDNYISMYLFEKAVKKNESSMYRETAGDHRVLVEGILKHKLLWNN